MIETSANVGVVISWPGLALVVGVLIAALETRLRMTFPTHKDLKSTDERSERCERLYSGTNDLAARGVEMAARNEERLEEFRRWLSDAVIKTLDQVSQSTSQVAAQCTSLASQQSGISAQVTELAKTVDRISQRVYSA